MTEEYSGLTDEEIVELSRGSDDYAEEYLIKKYSPLVKSEVRFLFLYGGDTEDLIQEGMIGLFKAIRDYNADSNASFKTFATLCVKNQIRTAITAANRKKHLPLNNSVPLVRSSQDGDDYSDGQNFYETRDLEDRMNPEYLVLEAEKRKERMEIIEEKLSSYEKKIIEMYLSGMSYPDMAKEIGKSEKSVNNALTRIRNKLKSD